MRLIPFLSGEELVFKSVCFFNWSLIYTFLMECFVELNTLVTIPPIILISYFLSLVFGFFVGCSAGLYLTRTELFKFKPGLGLAPNARENTSPYLPCFCIVPFFDALLILPIHQYENQNLTVLLMFLTHQTLPILCRSIILILINTFIVYISDPYCKTVME